MYMASWDPTLWDSWRSLATAPTDDVHVDIRRLFGATYGVCTRDFARMHDLVAPDIVYQDDRTFVFRVR
jgi:hypothetical protein